ncbi:hypothetical protein GGF42_002785, partial [Coemansia sp. RSA 2424]
MSEGPKRFSLSDYQSKRGNAKPAEAAVSNDQKTELEELHMLLGTGDLGKSVQAGTKAKAEAGSGSGNGASNRRGRSDISRMPGDDDSGNAYGGEADGAYEDEEGEDVEMADGKGSSKRDHGSSRRSGKRDSRDKDKDKDRDRDRRRRST